MGMNIKNAEAERLTRELAAHTGESLTTAVTEAVRERLARVGSASQQPNREEQVARLLALGRQTAPRMREAMGDQEHGDILYDERGLPR